MNADNITIYVYIHLQTDNLIVISTEMEGIQCIEKFA